MKFIQAFISVTKKLVPFIHDLKKEDSDFAKNENEVSKRPTRLAVAFSSHASALHNMPYITLSFCPLQVTLSPFAGPN